MAILPTIRALKSRSYRYNFRDNLALNLSKCIDDIINRAGRMGVSVDRLKLEVLVEKYSSYSGAAYRTGKAILDYYGYGYYKDGKWSMSGYQHYIMCEMSKVKPYSTISGILIDPDNIFFECRHCGTQDKRTQERQYWCAECEAQTDLMSELHNEIAAVKQLTNKLKKAITNENKRLENETNECA